VDEEQHARQEEDARRLAIGWGFEREERKWVKTKCAQIEQVFKELRQNSNN
jgi:hypothetical protein